MWSATLPYYRVCRQPTQSSRPWWVLDGFASLQEVLIGAKWTRAGHWGRSRIQWTRTRWQQLPFRWFPKLGRFLTLVWWDTSTYYYYFTLKRPRKLNYWFHRVWKKSILSESSQFRICFEYWVYWSWSAISHAAALDSKDKLFFPTSSKPVYPIRQIYFL